MEGTVMEHFLLFIYMVALLFGSWAVFYTYQTYKMYRLKVLRHYLHYTIFFNLALFFYQISAYVLINILGNDPASIPPVMRIVIYLVGFSLEACMTYSLFRTAMGLLGKEQFKTATFGLIAVFLLFCISFTIGLTLFIQSGALKWMNSTYGLMYLTVLLIIFSTLLITAVHRLPEKHDITRRTILAFSILYALKYGLISVEPVFPRQISIYSGALLLILANLIPLFWLRIFFIKHYAGLNNVDTDDFLNQLARKYGISSREREIIELILKGKSNKEIEDKLFISFSTVKNHIYNIYQKMGINSRGQLMVMVMNYPENNM